MGQPQPLLSFIFGLFKQTSLQFLQQINVKNVHPVYGAWIRTHDHGSRPYKLHGVCNLPSYKMKVGNFKRNRYIEARIYGRPNIIKTYEANLGNSTVFFA